MIEQGINLILLQKVRENAKKIYETNTKIAVTMHHKLVIICPQNPFNNVKWSG